MRVLFIHTRYAQSSGGEDAAVEAEMELLRAKGHEVELLLFNNADFTSGLLKKLKIAVSAIYNAASARKAAATVRRFKPDIVHVHNFFFAASPSVLYAIKKQGIPVIATLHNFRHICVNSLLLRDGKVCELCIHKKFPVYGVKYRCYHHSAVQSAIVGAAAAIHKQAGTFRNKVDLFITPSEFSRLKLLHSSFNVTPEKIAVKANFIEDPGFTSADTRKQYYLFVGRISAEKGVSLLIEAWKELGDRKLLIAGDGPELGHLQSQASEMSNIQFLGKQPRQKILELMRYSRALLFPSIWYEGLPVTAIEAFATGTPIIGSDLGAVRELIAHKENGILFAPGDSSSLRNAVHDFEEITGRTKTLLYDNARATYLERYAPQKSYERIMDLYSNLKKK